MHLDKQKPKYQVRLLEYGMDGASFKQSRNSNIYPNSEDTSIDKLWEKIKGAVEK